MALLKRFAIMLATMWLFAVTASLARMATALVMYVRDIVGAPFVQMPVLVPLVQVKPDAEHRQGRSHPKSMQPRKSVDCGYRIHFVKPIAPRCIDRFGAGDCHYSPPARIGTEPTIHDP